MKAVVVLALGLSFLQDKPAIRITLGAPTEKAWPVNGSVNRPDEVILHVSAMRIERRWDAKGHQFREFISPESRIAGKAVVEAKSFEANLRKGPPGLYRLTVAEEGVEVHAETILLGRSPNFAAWWRDPMETLLASCERVSSYLDVAEKVFKKGDGGGAGAEKEFVKGVNKEALLLEAIAEKGDLTATVVVLQEVCGHLRNAQIWAKKNGGGNGDGLGAFVDPNLSFEEVETLLKSAPKILSTELRISVAAMLSELLVRASARPEKSLPGCRSAAAKALDAIQRAPVQDKDFETLIRTVSEVQEKDLPDVRQALQNVLDALLVKS